MTAPPRRAGVPAQRRPDQPRPDAKARTLRMIGNAHIDPVWLWRWPEGFQEVWATFRSALDRLAEYPEAVFTASSAAFYDWIERSDPAMFEEIRTRVAEGRWAVVGGWWVEADANLPGGESLVRQALYAQRFFERAFGRIATVGYNPDGFGHSAMLPQILRKSGLESYVFMRPQPHEAELPGRVFWWQAPDGSRVLAARIVHEYCSPTDDLERYLDATVAKLDGEDWHDLLCFYGVGNHGGGPTKANLEGIRRMAADADRPSLRHARPESYFADLRAGGAARLAVHTGELQHHARGCYAAHSGIKQLNRSTEQLLLAAEKACAAASWIVGTTYPNDFEFAWRALLFNQFHDVLAGTAIESAYDDARDQLGHARAIAATNLHLGLAALARRIDIPLEPDARPIVVFNPNARESRLPVELEFARISEGDLLVDEAGRAVPFQLTRSEAAVSGSRTRPLFVADLPPLGWRVFRMLSGASAAATLPPSGGPLAAGDTWIATARLQMDVDATKGTFRLRDAVDGVELLSGAGRAVVLRDPGDTWAHGVGRFDEVLGEFRPVSVRLVECGPVRSVVRIESEFGASRLLQDVAVYRDLERVDVAVTLDWQERHAVLKLRFPTPLVEPAATYEIPYGSVERGRDGDEEPGQAWLDLSGGISAGGTGEEKQGPADAPLPEAAPSGGAAGDAARAGEVWGVSLINDAKYAYDVLGSEIGLTVARSPIYAHHEPAAPSGDAAYSYLDIGRQRFTYSLLPHRGSWRDAGTPNAAAALLQPPIALPETFHAGPLAPRGSFLAVDHRAILVSAVKVAEGSDALVVRAVETAGRPARATIALAGAGRWIDAVFGAYEIKTFLVPRDEREPIVEGDLLERPLDAPLEERKE